MGRHLVLSFVAFMVGCQAVTGNFSVGAEGKDSGASGDEGTGTGPDATTDAIADGPSSGDGASTLDGQNGGVCMGACVAVPSGWTLTEASFSATAPLTCGTAWSGTSSALFDTLNAPDASCACSCGAPSDTTCQIGISCTTGTCDTAPWISTTDVLAGTCQNSSLCGATYSVGASNPTEGAGGSCTPQLQKTVPPPSWADTATLCAPAPSLGTCPSAGVCALATDPGFKLCVESPGDDLACPSGWSNQHVEYAASPDDTRSCSQCTCGTPSGATCGGAFVVYSSSDCSGSPTGSYPIPDPCSLVGSGSVVYQAVPSGGSCAASSVSPTGSATPTGAATICCQ